MIEVQWKPKALKQAASLPEKIKEQVKQAVNGLEFWPNVLHTKKLAGRDDYRLRVGRYRIIFTIDASGAVTIILIQEVKKRDERTY